MSKRKLDDVRETEKNGVDDFKNNKKIAKIDNVKPFKGKRGNKHKRVQKGISKNECVCKPTRPIKSDIVAENDRIRINDTHHVHIDDWRTEKFQSPIEFKHDESVYHVHFDPLEFHGHWDLGGNALITNTGKTMQLTFQNRMLPFLKGGPLPDDFIFEQLHFHWGEDDYQGCEHIFEGKACSMEAHAVHYNKKYGNFLEACSKPDGLAVVAFFLLATDDTENLDFVKLVEGLPSIIEPGTSTYVEPDCLAWFKEGAHCKGYYTYQGSLTTEPYNECVTWILYPNPTHVSRDQVSYFRNLKSNNGHEEEIKIKRNIRPVQTPPEHRKLNVLYVDAHKNTAEK